MPEKNLLFRPVGYVRVSTSGQTFEVQLEQLCGVDCTKTYRKAIGGCPQRRELLKLLKLLDRGDLLTITRIDRSTG